MWNAVTDEAGISHFSFYIMVANSQEATRLICQR